MDRHPLFFKLSGLVVVIYYLVIWILGGMSGPGNGIENLIILPVFFIFPAAIAACSKKIRIIKKYIKLSILLPLIAIPIMFWENFVWHELLGFAFAALLIILPLLTW